MTTARYGLIPARPDTAQTPRQALPASERGKPTGVFRPAIAEAAASVILVHNHPSGDPTPSRADIEMTKRIIEAGERLNITIHDHVIIGRSGHASFRSLQLI